MAKEAGERARWRIVALVFAAIMLNYVDRQIIALLKPTLSAEFGWSERSYAHMASAFQFAAAIGYLGAGWFIDRVGLRRGFALGVGTWSLAGAAHAVVSGAAGFLGVRVVLGVAEATGTPALVKTAATYFGPAERGRMLGIGNLAPNVGAVLTPLIVPPVAVLIGWRATFAIAGALGFAWVIAWLRLPAPPTMQDQAATVGTPVRWRTLLAGRATWALVIAKALTDQCWWFLLFFIPDLFHRLFGLPQGTLGVPVALAYLLAGLGSLTGGLLPGWLIARGLAPVPARRLAMLGFALCVLPLPLVVGVSSAWGATALIGLALFAHQGFSTNLFALAADLFDARAVGSAVGLAAFAGNLAGMAVLELAGWSLDAGHGFLPMLALASVAYLLALLFLTVLPRRGADPVSSRSLA